MAWETLIVAENGFNLDIYMWDVEQGQPQRILRMQGAGAIIEDIDPAELEHPRKPTPTLSIPLRSTRGLLTALVSELERHHLASSESTLARNLNDRHIASLEEQARRLERMHELAMKRPVVITGPLEQVR